MEKMVPIETLTSMFMDPSSGSFSTTYLPAAFPGGTGTGSGSSLCGHAHAPGVLHAVAHGLVREEIELLLQVARDVDRTGGPEDIREPGAAHVARDDLGGETQVVQQVRQLPRGLRVEPLLLHDEALNRDDF